MNFKHMMVIVAMSTLVGQGAMAADYLDDGALVKMGSVGAGKAWVDNAAAGLTANSEGVVAFNIQRSGDIAQVVAALRVAQATRPFIGRVRLNVMPEAMRGFGDNLEKAFSAAPKASFTVAAGSISLNEQPALLTEVQSALGNRRRIVSLDGAFDAQVLGTWARSSKNIGNGVVISQPLAIRYGDARCETLTRTSPGLRVQVGNDAFVSYDEAQRAFTVNSASGVVTSLPSFTAARARADEN